MAKTENWEYLKVALLAFNFLGFVIFFRIWENLESVNWTTQVRLLNIKEIEMCLNKKAKINLLP